MRGFRERVTRKHRVGTFTGNEHGVISVNLTGSLISKKFAFVVVYKLRSLIE